MPVHTTPFTRQRLTMIALLVFAIIGIGLNLLLAGPFIPGLTWALAFAVVAHPLHQWLSSHIRRLTQGLAAGLSVLVVALALVLPAAFLTWQVGRQAGEVATTFQEYVQSGEWAATLEQHPRIARVWKQVEQTIDVNQEANVLADTVQQRAVGWVKTTVWGTVQILFALFALFYFFRDRDLIMRALRSMMPMSDKEAAHFFQRIHDMTHASIFGTIVVSAIQGALGGLMFWILGIPGPLLWGVCMGLLAIIPVFGAFVIWMPAALFLASRGDWTQALILTFWGAVVVGLIDNLLYPILVGNEMRLHTLPVFIAIVGGLFAFGAAGIVIGPIVLAGTISILDILRRRTSNGRSAENQAA